MNSLNHPIYGVFFPSFPQVHLLGEGCTTGSLSALEPSGALSWRLENTGAGKPHFIKAGSMGLIHKPW